MESSRISRRLDRNEDQKEWKNKNGGARQTMVRMLHVAWNMSRYNRVSMGRGDYFQVGLVKDRRPGNHVYHTSNHRNNARL